MLKEAASLDNIEFHYKFVDIFKSLRDFHTTYYIPGGHACVNVYQAVTFTLVGEGRYEKVVMSALVNNEYILDLSPESRKIKSGDELLSIDGIAIQDYLTIMRFVSGGANLYGSARATLSEMTAIYGKSSRLPINNTRIYRFRNRFLMQYQVELPWIAREDQTCKSQVDTLLNTLKFSAIGALEFEQKTTPRNIRKNFKDLGPTLYMLNHMLEKHSTIEPYIRWAIHKSKGINLGIIFLENFISEAFEEEQQYFDCIQGLLLNELKYTDVLLMDVRANDGGSPRLAELIPQLFSAKQISTVSSRVVSNKINEQMYKNSGDGLYSQKSEWENLYRQPQSSQDYTMLMNITTEYDANSIGQAYAKPVGVFTSAGCYSACELFATTMKDNKIAIIFGEDGLTGGGGATIGLYSELADIQRPDIFEHILYNKHIPLAAHDFSVGWVQIVRIDGSLIEDIGVKSDYILRPSISEIRSPSTSMARFDYIAKTLSLHGKKNGNSNLFFQIEPQSVFDVALGYNVTFDLESTGLDGITILDESNRVLWQFNIKYPARKNIIRASFQVSYQFPHLARYNIKGVYRNGITAYNAWRTVRHIPVSSKYLRYENQQRIEFFAQSECAGIFHQKNQAANGWNIFSGGVRIGSGKAYSNNLMSTYSIFIETYTSAISIDIAVDVEPIYTFLEIGYIKDNRTSQLADFDAISLNNLTGHFIFKDELMVGAESFELFFRFKSSIWDLHNVGKGVTIRKITLIT